MITADAMSSILRSMRSDKGAGRKRWIRIGLRRKNPIEAAGPDGVAAVAQGPRRGPAIRIRLSQEFARMRKKEEPAIPAGEVPAYQAASVVPDLKRLEDPPRKDRFQITWIGHATFLIQVGGRNFLSDPIYSQCCSPVYLPNLKRLAEPGIPFPQLPKIDAVLISHDHYDHLDRRTIRRLGREPHYFFPLGITPWFERMRFGNCHEADWGQTLDFHGINIHCVPAQHFSGRGVFDRNRTLWCGWVIECKGRKLYFAGDSGYSPLFTDIGREHGPIDCALIPIGAYSPRWFMHPVHVDPREAVKIHRDVRARRSIASHWGTFRLTDEPPAEPPIYLKKVLYEEGLTQEEFVSLRFGETIEV